MVSEKIPHANKNYRCHFGKTFKVWYMVILTDTDIQTIPKVFLHISREYGFTCGKHRNSQTAVVNTCSWHRHSAVSLPDCEDPILCNNYLVTSQFYWTMQAQPHLSRTGWYAETSLAEQDDCVLLQLWAPCSVHSDVANVALLACLAVQHRPSSITHTHTHTHTHTCTHCTARVVNHVNTTELHESGKILHNNNRFTALCPGLPGWAGTRGNIYPPTILIIQSLSASSIYHDP